MADELVNLFESITTDDHDALTRKFAEVMGTDGDTASFFLSSCSWNVEKAVNTFISTMGDPARYSKPVPSEAVSVSATGPGTILDRSSGCGASTPW